jgi:hypothetical protein
MEAHSFTMCGWGQARMVLVDVMIEGHPVS